MSYQLQEVQIAYWTEKHIQHMKKYAELAYGLHFEDEQYAEQVKKIRQGTPDFRCKKTPESRVFEIRRDSDNALMGDVVLRKVDGYWEIDTSIFDEFSGKGIATGAMKSVVQKLKAEGEKIVVGIIQKSNPNKTFIEKWLSKLGFIRHSELINSVVFVLQF